MASEETKYVYAFGGERADGDASMKELLGGKGANLAEMASIGIPVPAGFTISTDMCNVYAELDGDYPPEIERQVKEAMAHVEETMGARFGDPEDPLLVSVRSGARVSMPGMMDTVLNLGLNEDTLAGLIEKTGNERFAWDSYRRFVQMYGDVVLGMKPESKEEEDPFEVIIEKVKEERGVELDTDLDVDALKDLVDRFKKLVADKKGMDFPADPWEQLWGAVNAVFASWNNPRAIRYRKLNDIPGDWGTAVNVQAMVYGNMGDDCATGVAFTRDPATGENRFYGEFLVNAQGEDVVAGTRTPQQVNNGGRDALPAGNPSRELPTLEEVMPDVYEELDAVQKKLEAHYTDMQDIEFTIQHNTLWMLQTRTGKRTAAAAVRIAVEMVDEGVIDSDTAVLRVAPGHLDQLLHPTFDPEADKNVIAGGLPASPGAAAGKVVFHADDAEVWADKGEKVILVRIETSPEDIGGMDVAQGILTARGGMTSHAAVVARGMGKCCVAGAGDLKISYSKKEFSVGDTVVGEGDWISIDGTTGEIMLGQVPTVKPQLTGNFGTLMAWADEARRLGVRTNADTPKDAKVALDFGAEGIGLCRTEHMFFEGDRIKAVREMILADDEAGRKKALDKLLPIQRGDFYELFKACAGKSVTIRLLDPPLHEFVPHEDASQKEMADELGVPAEKIKAKVESLAEFNPMLGHRGCRLGITYPEITAMQSRAIIEAAAKIKKEGNDVVAEIMVPLVGTVAELREQKKVIKEAAETAIKDRGTDVEYRVGTMIEIPRAALTAGELAEEAEFFSFGTNDLTQMTFGYSRDDAGRFLKDYLAKGILAKDPFQSLDQEGVGQLVTMGFERGRAARSDLKVGICGEHGGDPASIEFCHRVGLDYVSCSPYRVPIARLAAAQAALKEKRG